MAPVLIVKNLTTRLEVDKQLVPIVENLSFSIERGKTLCLVGESGSGKTMAALSLMRILPHGAHPSTGEVFLEGRNLLAVDEQTMRQVRGGQMAMIFQDPTTALNPVYTIGSQLLEVAAIHLHLYGEEAEAKAAKALSEVGISSPYDRLNDYPHQLSGGMKQRVMIAMALMCEPSLLIADEPTTALDVTIQAQVLELIQELQERKGMAVLLITHDMGVVAEMADQVIVMYASQAVEIGSVDEVFDQMAHPYTLGLFNSRSVLQTPKQTLKPIKGSVPSVTHYPKGCRFHPRCAFAMEKCCHGEIPEFVVGTPHHKAKCVLYDGTEESNQGKWKV